MDPAKGVTIKTLALIDSILGIFANTTSVNGVGPCSIDSLNTNLTDCGTALVDALADLLYYAGELGAGLIPGFGGLTFAA